MQLLTTLVQHKPIMHVTMTISWQPVK